MKAVFSILKISHQNQRLLSPSLSPSSKVRVIPSLLHLAADRTLATFVPKKTHYEILGLSPSATAKEIRQAFLKLSKQCHPDATRSDPSNHKKFVQVNEAYSVLSKPISRREYDASMHAAHHMNASATQSHTYGHHPDSGHHTFYKGQRYEETDWKRAEDNKGHYGEKVFTNFYVITTCITSASVAFIFHYMYNYIPDTTIKGLRKSVKKQELDQHDLIMTSNHDGETIYYYAVPAANDPASYEVLAVKRNPAKDSDINELQELNSANYYK